jgi:uncharacterized protein with FMN-binding domain
MLLSMVFAWLTVFCCVMEIFRFFARISKKPCLNCFFHKIHIPFGVLAVVLGLVHGFLAGNLPTVSFEEIQLGSLFFTWNWGTACFILLILLGVTYLLRKVLKKHWMQAHRILTVFVVAFLVLHLMDMGIQLPGIVFSRESLSVVTESSVPEKEDRATVSSSASSETENTISQESSVPVESSAESVSSQTESEAPVLTFSGAVLADGVYEGTGEGRNGPITVSVTVQSGAVSNVEIISQGETPRYFERALSVVDSILSAQSLEVDGITGATLSSQGIKEACYQALAPAVLSGTLLIS